MSRTIAASDAREHFTNILDDAEKGETTLIVRHSRNSAAVVPASDLESFMLFKKILRELNETIELSEDPETIAAVIRAQEQINRGDVVWHD